MRLTKKVLTGLFLAYLICFSIRSLSADPSRSDLKKDRDETRLIELVLRDANEFLRREYGTLLPALQEGDFYPASITVGGEVHRANYPFYQRYRLIVYWSGKDLKQINPERRDRLIALAGDPFYAEGELIYRYLGFDLEGKKLHNPHFPSDSYEKNPSYTLKEPAKKAFWKAISERDALLRDRILANFNKSWLEEIDAMIEVYFKYRMPLDARQKELYKKNHRRHISALLLQKRVDARHINLISLPTDRVDGLAEYENSYNYYKAIVLKHQNATDQSLEIRHLLIEPYPGEPGKFKVSDRPSGIRERRDFRSIEAGRSEELFAKRSPYFACAGYRFFRNEDEFLQALGGEGRRKPFDQFVRQERLVYRYDASTVNERPVVCFFYLKDEGAREEGSGSIELSSEEYEVSRAIPSDEKVKIKVYAEEAVQAAYDAELREEELEIDLCFVQTLLLEDEGGRKHRERVEESLQTLSRRFSVHRLNYYKVFHLKEAFVQNEKLSPLVPIRIPCTGLGRSEVKVYADHVARIEIPETSQGRRLSLAYGTEEGEAPYKILIHLEEEDEYLSSAELEKIVSDLEQNMELRVRNDYLKIDGKTVLSDAPSPPDLVPAPNDYEGRGMLLEKAAHRIESSIRNGRAKTEGTLVYERVLDSEEDDEGERRLAIAGNPVAVHTPAANRIVLKREDAFDQRAEKNREGMAAPLDHIMELEIRSDLRHIDEKGYGLRDYQRHLRGKSLSFGFDVYVSEDRRHLEETLPEAKYFVGADKALLLTAQTERLYYKAAPWVKEGVYQITGVSIAKNALLRPRAEKGVNLRTANDAAYDKQELHVSGRLFDFAVERVYDPAFLSEAAGSFYSSGERNRESLPRRRFAGKPEAAIEKKILPVCAGKNPGSPIVKRDVKMGYPFLFSVRSMGSYFAEDELLILKPHFYHLDEGRINENIALYYLSGSEMRPLDAGGMARSAVPRDLLLSWELPEWMRSLGILKDASGKYGSMDYEEYAYRSARPVFCYEPNIIVLSAPFRSFIGSERRLPKGVDATLAKMSVQKWRGIYALPASTQVFALDEAGKPNLKKPLKKGSLGIVFEIVSARDGKASEIELSYVTDTANQYLNEGYRGAQGKRNFLTGTAILYSLEQRADEDQREQ